MCGKGIWDNNMVSAVDTAIKTTVETKKPSIETSRKLLKYIKGEPLKALEEDTFSSATKSVASGAAFYEGIPILGYLLRNHKIKKSGNTACTDVMKKITEKNKADLNKLFRAEGSKGKKVLDYVSSAKESNDIFKGTFSAAKTESKALKYAKKAEKIEKKLLKKPNSKRFAKLFEKFTSKSEKAATAASEILTKETASLGAEKVAAEGVKKAAAAGSKKAAGKLGSVFSKVKGSGAGAMMLVSGLFETIFEVIPTFKTLGKEKGMKQLGKSAVRVAGDTLGFVAGEQAGLALGTAIGTAIFPGIGTAIGAVTGCLCGLLGSFVMGKVTKAITGKTEREKAQEEAEEQQLQQINNDENAINQLAKDAKSKLTEEEVMSDGKLSDDSKEVKKILEEINAGSNNPFAA